MAGKIRIRVKTTAKPTSTGNIRLRTSVSDGRSTKTTTKTIRVK